MINNKLYKIIIIVWLIFNITITCLSNPDTQRKPFFRNVKTFSQNTSLPPITVSKRFIYPIGKTGYVTAKKDGDGWYNARDFREVNHLGEDWNAESGGNTDCGLPVRTISNGRIIFAGTNIEGWGNVLIIRHQLKDGKLIESLYGHLKTFAKTSGDVAEKEIIGKIGDGGGLYSCHLHLEIRYSNCPNWGEPGPGYSSDATGWTDPSSFINSYKK